MKTCARGAFHWDEHWRRRTVREEDGPSGKTTNSSGVKMLEMIPGASGLQIECGLFLWLTNDMGKLLQVMDVPCIELIHGGDGHVWGKNSMGMAKGLGEDDVRLWGCAHHVKEGLQLQKLTPGELEGVDRPWGSSLA